MIRASGANSKYEILTCVRQFDRFSRESRAVPAYRSDIVLSVNYAVGMIRAVYEAGTDLIVVDGLIMAAVQACGQGDICYVELSVKEIASSRECAVLLPSAAGYTRNIIEPSISAPVPTAIHENLDGADIRKNKSLVLAAAARVKVRLRPSLV